MNISTVEEALEHGGARLREEEAEEDVRYTWLKDYLRTLEGKEARLEYYAWSEEEFACLRGSKKGG
jgi:hypothetical protein